MHQTQAENKIINELRGLVREATEHRPLDKLRDELIDLAILLDEQVQKHWESSYKLPAIPDGYIRHKWIG